MNPLVECIPNVSEGRDPGLIRELSSAITAAGAALLDVHSDADHHRSVFTFVGTPSQTEEAALSLARIAIDAIQLDRHQGVHPRIGAVDVCPFVPLRGISLGELADRARQFGRRFAEVLHVPVYLYEASALRPQRVSLAHLRTGGYEGLKAAIGHDPGRHPDFGPAYLGPAGATVIGARGPLIAFNAYLDTDDLDVAKRISREIRESGGGLPKLRAMGVLVQGRCQVSMNVLDFRITSLYAIMQALEAAARAHGAAVVETELVGLVPQAALIAAARDMLRLPTSASGQLLEQHLGATLGDYREVTFE